MNNYHENWPHEAHQRDPRGYIRTATGGMFWPCDAVPGDVQIEDIGIALSNTARWGGHCDFYSVAQHAVRSAEQAIMLRHVYKDDRINPYRVLHHDDSEAYMTDLPRPIKRQIPDFKLKEDELMSVIGLALRFEWPMSLIEHEIDNAMLVAESRFLFPKTSYEDFPDDPPLALAFHFDPRPWTPEEARRHYFWMHAQLKQQYARSL